MQLGACRDPWVQPPGMSGSEDFVIPIRSEADITTARALAREVCKLAAMRGFAAQKVITSVSELARNITRYAGEGVLRSSIDADGGWLRIVAEDRGPGIANLEEVLAGRHRSPTGLGRGLLGTKRLADEFDIQTSDRGTRVAIAFDLGAGR